MQVLDDKQHVSGLEIAMDDVVVHEMNTGKDIPEKSLCSRTLIWTYDDWARRTDALLLVRVGTRSSR
jgi:hypothetical protein